MSKPSELRQMSGIGARGELAGSGKCLIALRSSHGCSAFGQSHRLSACLGRFSGPGTSGGLAPYRVSKAAVNALIRNFAAETGWGARGVLVDAVCPNHCRTPMGGPDAPRSADEGAETVAWLAQTDLENRQNFVGNVDFPLTGLLWEDQEIISW